MHVTSYLKVKSFVDVNFRNSASRRLRILETFFEDRGNRRREPSLMWCDSCVIAKN